MGYAWPFFSFLAQLFFRDLTGQHSYSISLLQSFARDRFPDRTFSFDRWIAPRERIRSIWEREAYVAASRNATTAMGKAKSTGNHTVEVTFWIADPPAVSFYTCQCSKDADLKVPPHVVGAQGRFVLLRTLFASGYYNKDEEEYFIYTGDPRSPSLESIPLPTTAGGCAESASSGSCPAGTMPAAITSWWRSAARRPLRNTGSTSTRSQAWSHLRKGASISSETSTGGFSVAGYRVRRRTSWSLTRRLPRCCMAKGMMNPQGAWHSGTSTRLGPPSAQMIMTSFTSSHPGNGLIQIDGCFLIGPRYLTCHAILFSNEV